jgi:RNA polymerase sigma factor for flagellar operon FliA
MNAFDRNDAQLTTTTRLVTLAERRRILVEKYGYLVKKVAGRMAQRIAHAGNCIEVDDLYAIGIEGLFDAEARYDASTGHSFETFAEFRIKGAMLDELRRRDFMPRRLRVKANKLERVARNLHRRLEREPTNAELATAMDLSVADYLKLERDVAAYRFVPVETVLDLEVSTPTPHQQAVRRQKIEIFAELLQQLSEREQLVLDLYFFRDLTLREIGDVLGVTEGRVSQIKSATVKKLREMAQSFASGRAAA